MFPVSLSHRLCSPRALGALALLLAVGGAAPATTLPNGFTETRIVAGISNPTAMDFAPDGRVFALEQGGAVRVVRDGILLSAPALRLTVDAQGERGLLGIAFDPDFATNQYVYLYYTVPGAGSARPFNRVSRFTMDGDTLVASTETVILSLEALSSATNHNGGAIHFGKDGMLYVAVGDNARGSNAQTLANRLGKVLRIRPDGGIPTDNPFYSEAEGDNRAIWALGLRNPFTFAIQPGAGRIFVNDVGQNAWEEINDGLPGGNYGWPTTEGYSTDARFISPLHAYGHGNGDGLGCAISGGAFYNPPVVQFPTSYVGAYFFADLCGQWIRRFNPATGESSSFATNLPGGMIDLKVGADGALYYLARTGAGGAVYRINATTPPFTLADAATALRAAAGLEAATAADAARLNVEPAAPSDARLDLTDAVRIARKATGTEPNP